MTPDISRHIDDHLRKLAKKVPDLNERDILNSTDERKWAEFASNREDEVDLVGSLENILVADLSGMCLKIASADLLHARSKLFDSIADLLAIDRRLVAMIEHEELR